MGSPRGYSIDSTIESDSIFFLILKAEFLSFPWKCEEGNITRTNAQHRRTGTPDGALTTTEFLVAASGPKSSGSVTLD